MSHRAEPVGGPIINQFTSFLLGLVGISVILLSWRFAAGLGATTALNDGYPFGLWIAFEVVAGTALACGGYAVAILLYVFNKGEYHPLIRPALLTSALGYSMAAFAIIIDVGRPWFIYRIPIRVGQWNLNSPLLEVALCVMAYVGVLWIELAPAFLEKWKESGSEKMRRFAESGLRFFEKAMIWIVSLGILLPTMHQSSLGTVMLLGGPKLHQLWNTPLIPLLFLVSCVAMGYAVVIFESGVSGAIFGRPRHTAMLAKLSGAMVVVLALFLVIRFVDLILRGRLGLMFHDWYSVLFWFEMALFAVPLVMLSNAQRRQHFPTLFKAASLMLFAGILYRFDTYLVAFNPGRQWTYFPSLVEILISVGVVSLEILLYIAIVKRYPILAGRATAPEKA